MMDRQLFGWRLRSAIPLRELLPWDEPLGGGDRTPDVTVELGAAAPLGPDATVFSPAIEFTSDVVRLCIPSVAAYRIESGKKIIIETVLPIEAPDLRVFLLGSALTILCYQRNLLPLHASAVSWEGRAILLGGASGVGKSTLAAALLARGARFLSDDLCAMDLQNDGPPLILPAFPRMKLWSDASRRLGVSTDGLERIRPQLEKHQAPIASDRFDATAQPPALMIKLRFADPPAQSGFRRLGGMEALTQHSLIQRWRLGLALGAQPLMFKGLGALARVCPVVEFTRRRDLADLDRTAEDILALAQSAPDGDGR